MPQISFAFSGYVNGAEVTEATDGHGKKVDVSKMSDFELANKLASGELFISLGNYLSSSRKNEVEMFDFTCEGEEYDEDEDEDYPSQEEDLKFIAKALFNRITPETPASWCEDEVSLCEEWSRYDTCIELSLDNATVVLEELNRLRDLDGDI